MILTPSGDPSWAPARAQVDKQAEGVALPQLMEPFPFVWCEQHSLIAGATRMAVRLPAPSGPE